MTSLITHPAPISAPELELYVRAGVPAARCLASSW